MKEFKKGDIIHSSYGGGNETILLVKKWMGEEESVHYFFRYIIERKEIIVERVLGSSVPRTDREATLQEKQLLLQLIQEDPQYHPFLQELYSLNLQNILE